MTRAPLTTAPDASGPPADPATVTCAARLLEAAESVLARWERGDLAAAIRNLDAAGAGLRARLPVATSSGAIAPETPDLFTPTEGDRP